MWFERQRQKLTLSASETQLTPPDSARWRDAKSCDRADGAAARCPRGTGRAPEEAATLLAGDRSARRRPETGKDLQHSTDRGAEHSLMPGAGTRTRAGRSTKRKAPLAHQALDTRMAELDSARQRLSAIETLVMPVLKRTCRNLDDESIRAHLAYRVWRPVRAGYMVKASNRSSRTKRSPRSWRARAPRRRRSHPPSGPTRGIRLSGMKAAFENYARRELEAAAAHPGETATGCRARKIGRRSTHKRSRTPPIGPWK